MKLRIGELELDGERFELRRGGAPVHLEPRVLELLLYLAAHRDRVVSKQELFDEVWKSKFVSESTLSGAVAEGRRALGGGEPQRSLIQTVHGRGYRFVLPAAAAPDAGVALAEQAAPVAVAPPAGTAAPTGRRLARRALAWLFLGAALGAVLFWRLRSTAPPETTAPRAPRLVLAPLAVTGQGEELRLVALSIQDLLSRRLEEVAGLELETPGGGLPASSPHSVEDLRRLGGGSYLVTGQLAPSPAPGRARLALTLYDFRSAGDPVPVQLTEHDVPFLDDADDLQRFVVLRDTITRQVLDRLLPAMVPSPSAASAPRHPEAYRLYLQALQPLREAVCVGPTALALLERSLALDPEFAPAWGELGWARYNSVSSCGESGENYALALDAAARALAWDPDWKRALALQIVVWVETGEAERAYATLLARERQAAPAGPEIPFFESYVLNYAGYLERSEALVEDALRRDPTFLAVGGWTPNAWLYRRDWDRFLELLPAGESPLFRYYRGFGELQRGRPGAAREVLEPAFRTAPNDLFARMSQALLALVEKRPDEARTLLDQLVLQRQTTGARDGEVTYKLAQLFALAGERHVAAAQAALAVEQGFFCTPCFEGDALLAPLLTDPAFAPSLAHARERHLAFGRRFDLAP